LRVIRPLLAERVIKGMAHITGGGITDNLPRILPSGVTARIDRSAWPVPPLFRWLQEAGHVPVEDMYRTFNMGIGLIVAVSDRNVQVTLARLEEAGEINATVIGTIAA
jgi:phosphoribosylformylglycinamidine cyclo-ligase